MAPPPCSSVIPCPTITTNLPRLLSMCEDELGHAGTDLPRWLQVRGFP